ncbi:HisA/HisF-related TIM barrel protein [Haloferax sp. S1W]|uniref:oxidoreductase n=1 Tax=Haloferax sp. S1W TaxID=3377110 RepID=UPI0037C6B980
MSDDVLFDTVTLNDLTLRNRAGLAPMTRVSATADGRATERMAHYYAKFADGGFSFLVTEGVYTDDAYSQGYLNQPGLVTDAHVEAWTQVTDAVHDHDTPIFAQLMHAGAQTQGNPYTDGEETIAPSAVQPDGEKSEAYGGSGEYAVPREATPDDLETVREGFVESATNAVEAGFDGVEIHAANGYLLNEFLAADSNQRDDEYGGAPVDRVRFPAEVVSAVVEATPDEFVVGVRVSQTKVTDDSYEWVEGEDAAAVFFRKFAAAGADYIHTVDANAADPTFGSDGPSLADAAAEYAPDDTVIVANGGLGDPDAARTAVESGADLFTLGTSALANPDWPSRVAAGDERDQFDPAHFLAPAATISDHEVPTDTPPADD